MIDRPDLSCPDVDDLAALYVLDVLDAAESAEVVRHLADHPERHPSFRELASVTPYLADTIEPVAPPPDLRARVLAQIAGIPQEAPVVVAAPVVAPVVAAAPITALPVAAPLPYPVQSTWAPVESEIVSTTASAEVAPTSIGDARERRERRRNPLWGVLAAAAVVAIVVLGGWNVLLQRQQSSADQRLALLTAAVTAAGQPGASVAQMSGTDTADGAAGYAVFPPDGTGYIVLTGLPAAGADQTWQAWTIADAPVSAGLVSVGSDGLAVLEGVERIPGTSVVALTLEPTGGSDAPTTTPVVVGQLGAPLAFLGGVLAFVP